MRVAVLNGPNLNLLGTREPEWYGDTTLEAIERLVVDRAAALGVTVAWHQTNHEGVFVDLVQGLAGEAEGAVVNAAAFSHTSLAIRDAFLAVKVPFVEVHLTNVLARDERRRQSVLADLAIGVVAGFGPRSYLLGLEALVADLKARDIDHV